MAEIAAIILAAGRSTRFREQGGAEVSKLVAEFRGEALVRATAQAALASKAHPVVVVTGHARAEVEAALAGLPLAFAFNPLFATGLASSLKAGVAALPPATLGAVVMLGDMPEVGAAAVDRLIQAFEARTDALAVVPLVEGRRGNPVLLGRALFDAVAQLTGDEGARRLLREADGARIVEVAFEDVSVARDVDTPDDLDAARKARG